MSAPPSGFDLTMLVRSAMSADPITVEEGTSLDDAIDLMDRHGICHLPIVRDGRLVGVVSDRDLLEATGWLPSRVRPMVRGTDQLEKVGQVMRSDAVIARPDESVIEAASEMLVQGLGCLPVMEADQLVGILATSDVLRTYINACAEGLVSVEEDPSAGECMTAHAITVRFDTTLAEARALCLAEDIRHLPVMDQGRLVGILSDRDLRTASGRGRREDYPVDEFMSTPVITASPDTPLTRCGERLLEKGIGTLPILRDDELLGMLSGYDVVRSALHALRQV